MALRGTILDLACGGGRNGRHFLESGHAVTFLDKDIEALADLEGNPLAEIVCADLETGAPFPLQDRQFNGVVVTNYLWRDILRDICGAVAPDCSIAFSSMMGRVLSFRYCCVQKFSIAALSASWKAIACCTPAAVFLVLMAYAGDDATSRAARRVGDLRGRAWSFRRDAAVGVQPSSGIR